MKKIIWLVFLFTTFTMQAQWGTFYLNSYIDQMPCPYDSTQTINVYHKLDFYQTSNNEVDGPRDSVCIPLTILGMNLGAIDLNRPLFFRLRANTDIGDSYLLPNELYSLSYNFGALEGGFLQPADCSNGGCSKWVIVTRERWKETGQDTVRKTEFIGNIVHNQCILEDMICMPTSKWDSIEIIDMWWEVYFNPGIQINTKSNVEFNFAQGFAQNAVNKIGELRPVTKPVVNHMVEISPEDLTNNFFGPSYLFVHNLPGIPSAQNRDDKKLVLSPNPNSVTDITLNFKYETVYFQEFTSIVPSLVEGSDTLYHRLNILQDGGDLCLEVVDLRIGDGTKFRYKSGQIDFADKAACIFFKKGSSFEIMDGSRLYYGSKSMGMLGLSDSQLKLGKAASLVFDGTLVINSEHNQGSVIELAGNARLFFGDNASVVAAGQRDEKVRVKAFPCQVDWGTLTEEEKTHFIFENDDDEPTTNSFIYPNPVSNELFFNTELTGLRFSITDLAGKIVLQGSCGLQRLDTSNLHEGVYIVQVGDKAQKLVKL